MKTILGIVLIVSLGLVVYAGQPRVPAGLHNYAHLEHNLGCGIAVTCNRDTTSFTVSSLPNASALPTTLKLIVDGQTASFPVTTPVVVPTSSLATRSLHYEVWGLVGGQAQLLWGAGWGH